MNMARDKRTRVVFFLVNICEHHDVQKSSKTCPFLVSSLYKREKNKSVGKLSSFYRAFLSKVQQKMVHSKRIHGHSHCGCFVFFRMRCVVPEPHTTTTTTTIIDSAFSRFPFLSFIKKIIKKKREAVHSESSQMIVGCWRSCRQ